MAVARHTTPGDADASSGSWWARPGGQVGLLTAAMSAASAGVALRYARDGVDVPVLPGGAWWLVVLAVLFALTEGFIVYVRTRRGAHGISLS
jgi:hypothetical protein